MLLDLCQELNRYGYTYSKLPIVIAVATLYSLLLFIVTIYYVCFCICMVIHAIVILSTELILLLPYL
jgi:hypothetical protein